MSLIEVDLREGQIWTPKSYDFQQQFEFTPLHV